MGQQLSLSCVSGEVEQTLKLTVDCVDLGPAHNQDIRPLALSGLKLRQKLKMLENRDPASCY